MRAMGIMSVPKATYLRSEPMNILNNLHMCAGAASAILLAGCAGSLAAKSAGQGGPAPAANTVKFTEVRSAAIKVQYGGTTFLVDPMLAPKGAYQGFPGTVNS